MAFKENESFKHKLAKNLLAEWLKEQEEIDKDHCNFLPFKWRKSEGIFTELKFHEFDSLYYFQQSRGLKEYTGYDEQTLIDHRGNNPLEWFDDSISRGKIMFVPDITIFHKGVPNILIEIVHSNPISELKKQNITKWYGGENVELYEVFADDILENTQKPTTLLSRRLI